jgi:hypothetical protein
MRKYEIKGGGGAVVEERGSIEIVGKFGGSWGWGRKLYGGWDKYYCKAGEKKYIKITQR